MKPLFRFAFSILLILLLTVTAVQAQERIALDAFYNSPDGFHIFIPTGWGNVSTEDYAHFTSPDADVDVFAASASTEDVVDGIRQVLARVLPDFAGEPSHVSTVILSNGTWTQQLYASDEAPYLTVYGQVYAGSTYVIVWHSAQPLQPVIVPQEEVQAGIGEGLALLGYEAPEPVATEQVTINAQEWTLNRYEDESLPAAAGYVRGETTLVMTSTAPAAPDASMLAFFNLLTDFFITPATTPYLYLGLVATAVISLAFVGTLVIRQRNLQKDLQTLETLQAEA